MKRKLLFLVFLISIINISYSQNGLNGVQNLVSDGFISTTATKLNTNIKGSPYITNEFNLAKISISSYDTFSVKYNAFLDEFEVLGKDDVIYAINKNESKDITITIIGEQKKYQIYDYYNDKNELTIGYFIYLNQLNSKIKLLKKERIIFISEKPSSNGYDRAQKAEYKRSKDKYYMKIKDQIAVLLPNNKKKLIKLFPGQENEISNFIKTEKIKLSKESDLIKLIKYLN